ncbi:6995_t:CDS:2 [Scutellospora calospora]|uniref:6995_t:CDS:1 n=1 Tax=Scutellospora calospora TaxID=85575 RepID=A0ACA9KJF6_9GLOM|nr:6995_t:CDS:2 [Scutellospora calospora]
MSRERPPLKEICLNFIKITKSDKYRQTTPHQKSSKKCKKFAKPSSSGFTVLLSKLDIDNLLAKFFFSPRIPFIAIENPFWEEFIEASNIRQESVLNFILCLPQLIFYNAKYSESESHTAEYIYNEFKTIIKHVGSFKFAEIITDNISSMRAAWRLLNQDYSQLICLGLITNLLDSKQNDLEDIIILYFENTYTLEIAAYIYGVIQKYIVKADEFSELLLWTSVKHSSPISWWQSNFLNKFSPVVELACRVLLLPASSAAAEHCWSNFGFIHNKYHARLDNNRVKKLVTVYQNLRIQKEIKDDSWFDDDNSNNNLER